MNNKINWEIIIKLMNCFPKSIVNHNGELSAYKAEPYNSKRSNDEFHRFILNGINQFLNTNFTEDDMEQIYTYLGNACNHKKTLLFIESGYDMSILDSKI